MSEYMISMEETFTVNRAAEECFRYIVDFSTLAEWDPNISASLKVSNGQIGLGSKFEVGVKFGLSKVDMAYEITEFQPYRMAVLTGKAENFDAVDTVTLAEKDGGLTEVTWKADITFRGSAASIVKLFEGRVRANGAETIAHLKKALEDEFPVPAQKRRNKAADRLVLPGLWKFTRFGYRSASRNWHPVSADMTGKHVVITGATSGLGLATAEMLAARGARLTLVARSREKAERIKQSISEKTGNNAIAVEIADLSLVAETEKLCARLLDRDEVIDVLINNAGALFNERTVTAEGLEKSFALLLLSPYILTERLISLLERSPGGRVINVASGGMYSQRLRVDDLESQESPYNGSLAYARAKRALVILTEIWAGDSADTGVVFNSMHPGWADTPGVSEALPGFYKVMKKWLRTAEQGADTITWLASATEAGKITGKFFLDREIHTTNMLPGTKSPNEERDALKAALKKYAKLENSFAGPVDRLQDHPN
jgi:NAD(P)-dependent dehydrogenase (short-subunit alcohol dehydrogenase family)/carbon monoxide dehydrogenase subunit G